MQCVNHQDQKALYYCVSCGKCFCPECVKIIKPDLSVNYICNECGGKCENLELYLGFTTKVPLYTVLWFIVNYFLYLSANTLGIFLRTQKKELVEF